MGLFDKLFKKKSKEEEFAELFSKIEGLEAPKNASELIRVTEKKIKKAIRIDPNRAALAYVGLGVVLQDLKRYNGAEKEYRKAIRLNPNIAEVHNNLGNLLKDLKRYNGAEKEYRKAIRLNPNIAEPHSNLGVVLQDLKRYDEAEREYGKAIKINPNLAELKEKEKKLKEKEKKMALKASETKLIATGYYKYIKSFVSRNKIFFQKYKAVLLLNIPKYNGQVYFGDTRSDIFHLYNFDNDAEERKGPLFVVTKDFIKRKHLDEFFSEFLKLKSLMATKGIKFSGDKWARLFEKEAEKQNYEELKTKILYNNPKSLDEYIDNFVERCGENYLPYLDSFKKVILKETPFSSAGIEDEIENFKKHMELERFAKKLEDSNSITMQDIDSMPGHEFENFLKTLFEKQGYKVELTKLSNDQGADLIVSKFGEKIVVQAKRYSAKVSNTAIQEAVAAIKHYGVDRGIVITNSRFTRSAIELAKSNNIELIDRDKLEKLIREFL